MVPEHARKPNIEYDLNVYLLNKLIYMVTIWNLPLSNSSLGYELIYQILVFLKNILSSFYFLSHY